MKRFLLFITFSCVVITGCDSGGSDDEPENAAPTAAFSFSPQEPRAGEDVTFTANAADSDGQVTTYSWDFDGDGAQDASGPNPTYAFEEEGNFVARLTVTDDDGATAEAAEAVGVAQRFNQVTVTRVVVTDMPFVNGSGAGWDLASGPDVFFGSFDDEDENLTVSEVVNDVAPSDLPLTLNGGDFTIESFSNRYAIAIFDADNLSNNEFIGGIQFDLEPLVGEYPSTLVLDAGKGVAFEISLDWDLDETRQSLPAKPASPERRAGEGSEQTEAPEGLIARPASPGGSR